MAFIRAGVNVMVQPASSEFGGTMDLAITHQPLAGISLASITPHFEISGENIGNFLSFT